LNQSLSISKKETVNVHQDFSTSTGRITQDDLEYFRNLSLEYRAYTESNDNSQLLNSLTQSSRTDNFILSSLAASLPASLTSSLTSYTTSATTKEQTRRKSMLKTFTPQLTDIEGPSMVDINLKQKLNQNQKSSSTTASGHFIPDSKKMSSNDELKNREYLS
jgi:hypothetical protein